MTGIRSIISRYHVSQRSRTIAPEIAMVGRTRVPPGTGRQIRFWILHCAPAGPFPDAGWPASPHPGRCEKMPQVLAHRCATGTGSGSPGYRMETRATEAERGKGAVFVAGEERLRSRTVFPATDGGLGTRSGQGRNTRRTAGDLTACSVAMPICPHQYSQTKDDRKSCSFLGNW